MIERIFIGGPVFFMIVCELLSVIAFCPRNKRNWRKRLWFKILLAVLLVAAISFLDYRFVDFNTGSTALEAPFCFAASFVFAFFALGISEWEALYCTIWAYMVTEVTAQVVMPVTDIFARGTSGAVFYGKYILVFAVGAAAAYCMVRFCLADELQKNDRYLISREKISLAVAVVGLYFILSNYQFIFWLLGFEPEKGSHMITVFRLIAGLGCICFLFMQNSIEKKMLAERELDMIQQLWYRQQNQYQLSLENIDLINRKCHDLKHQMAALSRLKDEGEIGRQLKELEHSVMIYDSVIKTGNPVLDTVLTEKCLLCEEHQINMTCMADGSRLEFVDKVDLYTMFGNALDNAIESVMKQRDKEKRVIQVSVFHEKSLLMIRIRNYCEEKIRFVNGSPVTTKKDKGYHGFGLKSIRYTAEKYGGGILVQAHQNYFTLQILIPLPEGSPV